LRLTASLSVSENAIVIQSMVAIASEAGRGEVYFANFSPLIPSHGTLTQKI